MHAAPETAPCLDFGDLAFSFLLLGASLVHEILSSHPPCEILSPALCLMPKMTFALCDKAKVKQATLEDLFTKAALMFASFSIRIV